MSKIERGMLSSPRRVRRFVVERDVSGDSAEPTRVRRDHDDTVCQRIADAAHPEAIATQSYEQATEVKRPRLGLGERQRAPTVCTTRSSKLEIRDDDIGLLLSAAGVNDESLAANDKSFAANDDAIATLLRVFCAAVRRPGACVELFGATAQRHEGMLRRR